MLMFALFLSAQPAAALSGQSGPAPVPQPRPWSAAASELYAAPVVRPYEPPSDFGRQIAEGDADATVRTRPITAPVAVEAYSDTYETRRSRREISYQQGVEAARQRQNARMGPLDGIWRVVDAQGRPLLDLILSDSGSSRPVEGAMRLTDTDRTAVIEAVTTEGETRIITAALDGRPMSLRLHRQGDVWAGDLSGAAVSLVRPEGWAP
jgi:hypothetical protein